MRGVRLGFCAAAVALGVAVATVPAPAQVNPTAQSVKEEQLLDALKGGALQGRITIPDVKAATLMQPAGRDYQQLHASRMKTLAAVAIVGMLALLAVFFFMRGRIRIAAGASGATITRFGGIERFIHWLTAVSFLVLAISGLNLIFGRQIVLPLIGESAFGSLSIALKYAHNFLAFPFMAGLALMFLAWVRDNIPGPVDVAWLKAGGGIVGNAHPPARRFNGGQKAMFWLVILGGLALSVSGWMLLFPFTAGQTVADQQSWQWLHGMVGVLLTAVIIAHIYIGSLGMEGAFDAMGSGEVDLNWAKEHHSLWVEEEMRKHASAGKVLPAE